MRVEGIAADWGASRLRVWAMDAGGILAEATVDLGQGGMAPEAHEPALTAQMRALASQGIVAEFLDAAACCLAGLGIVLHRNRA